MYAVKISHAKIPFVVFAGRRGEKKSRLEKVEGWKKHESAENFIKEQKQLFGDSNFVMYEIIQF